MGWEMVPFERAFVSSYRPSIVTFPLSFTRFRDIAAFVFQNDTFLYPTSSLPKISPMFSWEYVDRLMAANSEGVGLIVHVISFQDFQPV